MKTFGKRNSHISLTDSVLAAILHDVGIPAALTKYGSVSHHQQEAEGVPVARRVLARLQVRADVAERVCYIANFSTPTGARLIRQVLGL